MQIGKACTSEFFNDDQNWTIEYDSSTINQSLETKQENQHGGIY